MSDPNEECPDHSLDDANTVPPVTSAQTTPGDTRPTAKRALIEAAFEAATTASQRRLLKGNKPVVIAVHVPTTSWLKPIRSHIDTYFKGNWQTYARDGSNRSRDKASVGSDEVVNDIQLGRSVAGIAANLENLPAVLTASADAIIKIPMLSAKIVSEAIRRFTGRSCRRNIENSVVAGLDFEDILATFRPGSSASEIIRRLTAAARERHGSSTSNEDVPHLSSAVEYGAAREWGMTLARDIADYRAGLIDWNAIDRGVVIHSEPGLGKSLYARMLARECGVPLVISSVGELFATSAGDLGAVIKAERAVFARASALAPCILFWDELDALPSRASLSTRNRDWWLPVVTDYLTNLDSAVASQRELVIVVGATNYVEHLDPALLRPGRFERTIHIERPDLDGTVNILRYHVRDANFSDAELVEIARMIEFSTGAEIMMLVRDARRRARHAKRKLSIDDLRSVAIPEADAISRPQLLRASIHEAGHAIAALVLSSGTLKKAVIRDGRQGALGGTHIEFDMTADGLTRESIEDHVTMLLSGRAAEKIILGAESIGAGGVDTSDLAHATRLIAALHISFGLGDTLTYLGPSADAQERLSYDPLLRDRVEKHLGVLQERAYVLVEKHREAIERVASSLSERKYLSGDAIREIKMRSTDPSQANQSKPARTGGNRRRCRPVR
jgi:cell division protease FtsH